MANAKSVTEDKDGKWVYRFKRSAFIRHPRMTQDDDGVSNTRQEFRDECDINVLMKKYEKSGLLPTNAGSPQYGDFGNLPDFMEAQNTIAKANEAFALLPASVRLRFGNDPAEFVDFASDPDNLSDMRRWGLAPPASDEAVLGAAGGAPGGQPPAPAPVSNEGTTE